jgi:hypothetical protein
MKANSNLAVLNVLARLGAGFDIVSGGELARALAAGRGAPKDVLEAMKWHILARAGGLGDPWLESKLPGLTAEERAAVEQAVQRFIGK